MIYLLFGILYSGYHPDEVQIYPDPTAFISGFQLFNLP
jgi:hypothetical protein